MNAATQFIALSIVCCFCSLYVSIAHATNQHIILRTIPQDQPCIAEISVSVTPATDVQSYLLEERLPYGFSPINISDNGNWDTTQYKIKWGPFNDVYPRVFTYQISGMDTTYYVEGMASFDGSSQPVEGESSVTFNCYVEPDSVATPVILPQTGTTIPVDVSITCATPGSEIRYTLDGSLPYSQSFLLENSLSFSSKTILRARGFKSGLLAGKTATAFFPEPLPYSPVQRKPQLNNTCQPQISISIMPYASVKSYAVQEFLPDGLIPYQINENGKWIAETQTIYWGPFLSNQPRSLTYVVYGNNGTYTIKGIASFDGAKASINETELLVVNCIAGSVEMPQIYPQTGTTIPVSITMNCGTPDVDIRYTTDGTTPTIYSQLYTGEPLLIETPTRFQAFAFKAGMMHSLPAGAFFSIEITSIWGDTTRSIISNPDCSASVFIAVTPTSSIKSYAVEEVIPHGIMPENIMNEGVWDISTRKLRWGPFLDSNVRTFSYDLLGSRGSHVLTGLVSFDSNNKTITGDKQALIDCLLEKETIETPVFMPPSGSTVPVSVTITCATPDVDIYYTTDGRSPVKNDILYSQPIEVTQKNILRARAFHPEMTESAVATAFYINEIIDIEPKAEISYHIIENSTCSPSIQIAITPNTSVKSYLLEVLIPYNVTPSNINENGIYDSQQTIIRWGPYKDNLLRVFSFNISGMETHFQLLGSASFDGKTQEITETIDVDIDCNWYPVLEQVKRPVFDPSEGASVPLTLTISCETPGAIIRYTTDGTVPDQHSDLYEIPIFIDSQKTIRAIAFKDNMQASEVISVLYSELHPLEAPVRTISYNGTCEPTVQLEIFPGNDVLSYNLEEYLPEGLVPENISHNGYWDDNQRKIKWGPFINDYNQNTFSFSIRSTNNNFSYDLSGIASFDGKHIDISGDQTVIITCVPPEGFIGIAGNEEIYLIWEPTPSASGYIIHYGTNMMEYEDINDIGKFENDYYFIENLINNTTYHIAITAYDEKGIQSDYSPEIRITPSVSNGKMGRLYFDKSYYGLHPHTAIITVKDNDLNLDINKVEHIDILLKSDSDATGFTLLLSETGNNTGVFVSASDTTAGFTIVSSNPEQYLLKARHGERVKAYYNDINPASNRTTWATIDAKAPVSKVNIDGYVRQQSDNSFIAETVSITFSANDADSGIDFIEYQINNTDTAQYKDPIFFHSEGAYTVTFASVDIAGNYENKKAVFFNISPIAEPPVFNMADHIQCDEDQRVLFQIAPVSSDSDGSETLSSLIISNVPETAQFSDGTRQSNGNWLVPIDQLTGLIFTPPLHNASSLKLNAEIQVTETETGDAMNFTDTIIIDITPVADPPYMHLIAETQGKEDSIIPITIRTLNLVDTDGSEELLPVIIEGVPEKATLSAGTRLSDGRWQIHPNDLAGLLLTPEPNDFSNFILIIQAFSREKENQDIASKSDNIYVTIFPSNDAPTISAISDKIIPVNNTGTSIPFNIYDVDTSLELLQLQAYSSYSGLIPNDTEYLSFSGSGELRYITITPLTDKKGMSMITINVIDNKDLSASTTFKVTIGDYVFGDIDNNGIVEMFDGILALKILSDIDISNANIIIADVNEDGRNGLAELIYILWYLSENQ